MKETEKKQIIINTINQCVAKAAIADPVESYERLFSLIAGAIISAKKDQEQGMDYTRQAALMIGIASKCIQAAIVLSPDVPDEFFKGCASVKFGPENN